MSNDCPNFLMEASPKSSAQTPNRILVVDDIADNYLFLQIVLEAEGYIVETADNGYAALTKVEADPPDLVLLDVMMPDMNGYEVTQHIRQNPKLPFIPILLITAYDEAIPAGGVNAIDGFFRKPIELDELLGRIRAILSART